MKKYFTALIRADLISRCMQARAREGESSIWRWVSRILERYLRMSHPDLGTPGIFLDDERSPPLSGRWEIARSYEEFVDLVRQVDPPTICFDHDLSSDATGNPLPDGMACMRYLIALSEQSPASLQSLRNIVLHSANPIGRSNLRGLLESAQRVGILAEVIIEDRPVTTFPLSSWAPR